MNTIAISRIYGALIAIGIFVLMQLFAGRAVSQEITGPIISPLSIWYGLWTIVQPIVVMVVSTVGPIIAGWLAARVLKFLKLSDEAKQAEIEARLREALHQSATNALKFALAKTAIPAASVTIGGTVIAEAIRYVEDKNPETIRKLGVPTDALADIIMSKLPDLIGRR